MKNDEHFKKATSTMDLLAQDLGSIRVSQREHWKHITTILATIVGLSTVLLSQGDSVPNSFVLSSLVLMLITMLIGFLIIKEDLDLTQHNKLWTSVFQYNSAIIMARVSNGELDTKSEEYIGLTIANFIELTQNNSSFADEKIFNRYSEDLADKYRSKLPFQRYLKKLDTKKGLWISKIRKKVVWKHLGLLITAFYLYTTVSFGLLLAGIIIK